MGTKSGLATKEEVKTLWKVVSKELPIPSILKPLVNAFAPGFINGFDDKYLDRIPDPWQSYLENLVTMVVKAVEDGNLSEDDLNTLLNHCGVIMNQEIDIPLLDDDTETIVFLQGAKLLASIIYKSFRK